MRDASDGSLVGHRLPLGWIFRRRSHEKIAIAGATQTLPKPGRLGQAELGETERVQPRKCALWGIVWENVHVRRGTWPERRPSHCDRIKLQRYHTS